MLADPGRPGAGPVEARTGVDASEPRIAATRKGPIAWIEALPPEGMRETGPPIVLVHGFTGHRDDFLGVLNPLARLAGARRVLALDLRGHGDSAAVPGTSGWGFEQLVSDLLGWLDHLEIDRIDLLGHSMGGFVALRFALAHPERVRSLVLVCTGPEVPATLDRTGFLKAAEIAEARGMAGLQALLEKVGRIDPSPSIARWGERYWAHQRRRFSAMTPESYRALGSAFFDSPSLVSRLREIRIDCLVLVGEFDRDWLPGADLFERNLPTVQRQTIADAEHHPHNENPEAFLAALGRHFESIDRPGRSESSPASRDARRARPGPGGTRDPR